MSRRAATATTSTLRSPFSSVEWPTTCQSRTAWSSGIGMWSWAWKRIAVSSSSRLSIAGRRMRADGDALVAMPTRTSRESFCSREELLDRLAERVGVGDLALAEDSRAKRHDATADDLGRAVHAHFGRGDAAGLDVEADNGLALTRGRQVP